MKKMWLMSLLMALVSIPFVAAADFTTGVNDIWWKILSVGNLTFLGMSDGSVVVALTRILIGFLVFTILFAVITAFSLPGKKEGTLGFLNRGQAGVVAGIVAIIAAIFLPANVLLATGSAWAIAIAFLLIGGPIVGLFFLMYSIPNKTRGHIFLKFVLCLMLYWILSAVKYHVGRMV